MCRGARLLTLLVYARVLFACVKRKPRLLVARATQMGTMSGTSLGEYICDFIGSSLVQKATGEDTTAEAVKRWVHLHWVWRAACGPHCTGACLATRACCCRSDALVLIAPLVLLCTWCDSVQYQSQKGALQGSAGGHFTQGCGHSWTTKRSSWTR